MRQVDGAFIPAAQAAVGASLSTGVITRISASVGGIINPVTASGTILVADKAGGAPVAKTVPFQQTVEVAGVAHTLDDEYQWLRGKAWPKLVQDEDIIAHLEAENACETHGLDLTASGVRHTALSPALLLLAQSSYDRDPRSQTARTF